MRCFIDFLSLNDILYLHEIVIKRFGGMHGLRDSNLLESALFQPQVFSQTQQNNNVRGGQNKMTDRLLSFFTTLSYDKYMNKDIFQMAATYSYQIIRNQPFIDGNKRTGIIAAMTFLEKNGIIVDARPEELCKLTIGIKETKVNHEESARFFRENMR